MRNAARSGLSKQTGKEIKMLIKDFKGRLYKFLECDADSTLLEMLADGSRVRIRSWGWDAIGFVRP